MRYKSPRFTYLLTYLLSTVNKFLCQKLMKSVGEEMSL